MADLIKSDYVPGASQVTQWYRICLLMQETQVQSLGGEDPLEKEVATHPSILAWEIRGQRNLEGYSPWGRKCNEASITTSPNGVNRWKFGERGAQEEGMEGRCPFPIPCPKHRFHLAVPELVCYNKPVI